MTRPRFLFLLPLVGVLGWGSAFAQDGPGSGPAGGSASGTASETADVSVELTPESEASDQDLAEPTEADRAAAEEAARSEFNRELRSVEQQVNELKERVFRSKATLQLLKELVIEGATMGSRVVLWHINRMGPAYTMESVQYFLDGKNVFTRVDPSGSLDQLREVKVHEQTIPPGNHNLQVHAVLRGSGFGVFSYLKTYSFKVQSSYTFEVEDGRLTTVRVIANERPGLSRTFVDRPGVQYEEEVENLREE